jgi:hypothetical protein
VRGFLETWQEVGTGAIPAVRLAQVSIYQHLKEHLGIHGCFEELDVETRAARAGCDIYSVNSFMGEDLTKQKSCYKTLSPSPSGPTGVARITHVQQDGIDPLRYVTQHDGIYFVPRY